jgi:hypothetical protein
MGMVDMSPSAVTVRLARTSQLRRLCLALRRPARREEPPAAERTQPSSASSSAISDGPRARR